MVLMDNGNGKCLEFHVVFHSVTNKLCFFSIECASENCILQCPFNEQERPCICKDGTKIYNSEFKYFIRLILNCY